jgi:Ca2+-binding EF-hand superfamily protein
VDITPDELHDMVVEFDADGDGLISEGEFAAILAAADE